MAEMQLMTFFSSATGTGLGFFGERSFERVCELEGCLKLLRGEMRPVELDPSLKTLVVPKVNGVEAADVEAVAAEEEADEVATVVVAEEEADPVAEIEALATIAEREVTSQAIARTREW